LLLRIKEIETPKVEGKKKKKKFSLTDTKKLIKIT